MKHLDHYLDKAIEKQSLKSDIALSRLLGFKGNPMGQWRTKRTWPSDETIVKIAELAGEDPEQALMDLNIWRASGKARVLYERIASRTIQAFALAAVTTFVTPNFGGSNAEAATDTHAQAVTPLANNLYYGKLLLQKVSKCWNIISDRLNDLFSPVMSRSHALST